MMGSCRAFSCIERQLLPGGKGAWRRGAMIAVQAGSAGSAVLAALSWAGEAVDLGSGHGC